MFNHGKSFHAAQMAWDNMEPLGDHDTEAMDDYCEPDYEPDDTDWDAIDFGDFYDGTGR